MFCPDCQTEYVEGVTTCGDCGVPLVEKLPPEPPEPPEPAETVEVWTGNEELLYNFLANALAQAGIEYHSRTDESTYLFGSAGGFGPPFSLWVHRDQASRARELIQECLKSFETEPSGEGTSEAEPS